MSYMVTASELSILIETLGELTPLVRERNSHKGILASFTGLVKSAMEAYKKQLDGGHK